MKKDNLFFLTLVTVYAVVMTALLLGCKSTKPITASVKDSTIVKYYYHDSIITVQGDTVRIKTTVPCPEAKWKATAKSGRSSLVASLSNGELSIDCKQDSLLLRISLLEKELERKTNTIVQVPVPREVIRYRTPWWAKITLGICIILLTGFCIKHWQLVVANAKALVQFFI